MGLIWGNFCRAKLATPPSGTGGLSFTVEAGKGALFPSFSAGDYAYCVFKNADKSVNEVVKVEARSTDAFTIAAGGRGLDGTTAQTWTANDYVELCVTRIALLEVFNPAVVAIGAVTPAADRVLYFTSGTAAAVLAFPSWARTMVSAANVTAGANALLNTSGNIGFGTADTGTAGLSLAQQFNISWTQSSTESIPNLFRMTSASSLVAACGVKWSANANEVVSSYGSSIGHSAIEVSSEFIRFSVNAAAAVPVGDVVTLTERMRITKDGRVGIGISNPSYKLVVSDGGAAGIEFDPTAGTPLLQAYNRSTLAYASMQVSAATIRFHTGATPAEAARIDGNKYLLVGYTSSNGAYPLQVNGQIFATSATIATSDGRYKKAVREITGGLAIVTALRPVSFKWKDHPVHSFELDGDHVGFIAQEVRDALAGTSWRDGIVKSSRAKVERGGKDRAGREMVDGIDEEFLGIAEGKLIPLLVSAVKELRALVDAQADRIAALESKAA